MNATILWHFPALARFYMLTVEGATTVDRAVLRFAATGEGHIEWVAPYHRLRAGPYEIALAIDVAANAVTVIRIYRTR